MRVGLTTLFFFLSLKFLFSQFEVVQGEEAGRILSGAEKIRVNKALGTIDHVRLKPSAGVDAEGHLQWLRSDLLEAPSHVDFELMRKKEDQLGFTHYRYQQYYRGMPVRGAVYFVHVKDGRVISANGVYHPVDQVDVSSSINAKKAFQKARDHIGAEVYRWEREPSYKEQVQQGIQKLLFPLEGGERGYVPAFRVDIYALKPLSRDYVYVGAKNGKVIHTEERIHTSDSSGTAETMYHGVKSIIADYTGTQFLLKEYGRGGGIETYDLNNSTDYSQATDFTDGDNYWDDTTDLDHAAYNAHYSTEMTYDYFYQEHSRNSYDNSGSVLESYVHYGTDYTNAFWDGTRMTYGDGGTGYSPLTPIDIVAHEITHGVTQHTADLDYSYESGALNESFSDIFGVVIDHYAHPSSADYLMGEEIGSAFRNLKDPNQYSDPDTYKGNYWHTGSSDNGGVHTNSGVQNYWFYLLVEGGSGTNDNGDSYTVTGIGMNDAAEIAYRNLSVYLTSTSEYSDARYYAIEAAKDLFGSCSQQVVSTTNAWYAVGVGSEYNNSVTAGFQGTPTYYCQVPATVEFTDQSINAKSYYWDFGDGDTSSAETPSHIYDSTGVYTVQQIVMDSSGSCDTADTLTRKDYITLVDSIAPHSAACTPVAVDTTTDMGVHYFELLSISNSSSDAGEGFLDKTCTFQDTLLEGKSYNVDVRTSPTTKEDVKIWIDLNNDGDFGDTTELVYRSFEKLEDHSGSFIVPELVHADTALRLRVGSDHYTESLAPCVDPQYGQFEDYTVRLMENDTAPVVDFAADTTVIPTGSSVDFTDLTLNLPDTWEWEFSGGVPVSSTDPSPTVSYPNSGSYSVRLKCTNSHGADSLVKTDYISVINEFNICADDSSADTSGTLYDSGGSGSNYSNYENCSFLIDPGCGDSITLSFKSFDVESYYDELNVYDGTSSSDPLLLSADGTSLPPSVTANSGTMYLVFDSDGSITRPGFEAEWETHTSGGTAPTANLTVNDTNPPLQTQVDFDLQSSPSGAQQYWDFGDGTQSSASDPSHSYSSSGSYTVTAIASNCFGSDTVTQEIQVQSQPEISYTPDTLRPTVSTCGDSVTVQFTVENLSGGDLVYEAFPLFMQGDSVQVLSLLNGADISGEYANTINALDQSYSSYQLSEISTSDASVLDSALDQKDVLLIPEQYSGVSSDFSALAPSIDNFAQKGGVVIFCGMSCDDCLFNTGLLSGTYESSKNSGTMDVVGGHALVDSLSSSIYAESSVHYYDLTGGASKQVDAEGFHGAAHKAHGDGSVVYIGYDYYSWNQSASTLIGNAVKLGEMGSGVVSLDSVTDTLAANDSSTINATFYSKGLIDGTHQGYIVLESNDPASPDSIPFYFSVEGSSEPAVSDSCLSYPSIMEGTDTSKRITLYNNGCDTLRTVGFSNDSSAFLPDTSAPFRIDPWDSLEVKVRFQPDTPGTVTDTLLWESDSSGSIPVCLEGTALPAPELVYEPDTIQDSVLSCGDSVTVQLDIINEGNGGTNIELETMEGIDSDSGQVLALTNQADLSEEYANTLDALQNSYNNYELSEVNTTDSTVLADSLVGKHVLLIPEQESGDGSVNNALAPAIQDFADRGGTVIICGMGCEACVTNTGLFSGSLVSSNFGSGLSFSVVGSHTVVDSLPSSVSSVNANYWFDFSGGSVQSQVEYNGYDVVAHTPYGKGSAIYIGYDYYNWNSHSSQLIGNAVRYGVENNTWGNTGWVALSDTTDSLASQDTTSIDVTLHSQGLNEGVHEGEIIVYSSDPSSPDTVPVIFTVKGDPRLALSDSCIDFSDTLAGASKNKKLKVYNRGCDTLEVNSAYTDSPAFSVDTSSFMLLPDDSLSLNVEFAPGSPGTHTDTLTLQGNNGSDKVCLEGTGNPAPDIEVDPDQFQVDLAQCSDSTSLSFTVRNDGGGPLYTETSLSSDTVDILALTYGADYYNEFQSTVQALDDDFRGYRMSEVYTTDSAELADSLTGKDVLLLSKIESGLASSFADLGPAIRDFVKDGGTVILGGTDKENKFMNLGLFSGTYVNYYYNGTQADILNDHPLRSGIGNSINTQTSTYSYTFSNADTVRIARIKGTTEEMVTVLSMGKGQAIYLGYSYASYNNDASRLLGNAVRWGGEYLPQWIKSGLGPDTIASGDSVTYQISFHNDSLKGGTYIYSLPIESNDPDEGYKSVSCTMNVSMEPCAVIEDTMPVSCNGELHLADSSVNNVSSWTWDLGDGSSSSQQHPVHTYNSGGSYTVELIACNSYGCDTTSKMVTIPPIDGPKAASCKPSTQNYYCCYGVTSVSFAGLNDNSSDASVGYEDRTCGQTINVMEGKSYQLEVTTGESDEEVRVWIDYDNSGSFDNSELVMDTADYTLTHTDTVTIPYGVTLGKPLRMRVMSDDEYYSPTIPDPCYDPYNGQAEDHSVKIGSNNMAPVAKFGHSIVDSCSRLIHFQDQSLYNATSWKWDFGDGSTSLNQDPYHQYDKAGIYTVTLIVSNSNGSDTISKDITVTGVNPDIKVSGATVVNKSIQFISDAPGAMKWKWYFGDGDSASTQNPTHTYTQVGSYEVELRVSSVSGCKGIDKDSIHITKEGTALKENGKGEEKLIVYPNPASEQLNVEYVGSRKVKGLIMESSLGERVYHEKIRSENGTSLYRKVFVKDLPKGMYYLKVLLEDGSLIKKVVVGGS